jgi:hypothetical protein
VSRVYTDFDLTWGFSMRTPYVAILPILLCVSCATHRPAALLHSVRTAGEARALFELTIRRVAGAGAVDCGVFEEERQDPTPGVHCVGQALHEQQPFFFGQGTGGYWDGYTRDAAGRESMITVDTVGAEPYIHLCDTPLLVANRVVMSCDPIDYI